MRYGCCGGTRCADRHERGVSDREARSGSPSRRTSPDRDLTPATAGHLARCTYTSRAATPRGHRDHPAWSASAATRGLAVVRQRPPRKTSTMQDRLMLAPPTQARAARPPHRSAALAPLRPRRAPDRARRPRASARRPERQPRHPLERAHPLNGEQGQGDQGSGVTTNQSRSRSLIPSPPVPSLRSSRRRGGCWAAGRATWRRSRPGCGPWRRACGRGSRACS